MKKTLRTIYIIGLMAGVSLTSCSLDPKLTENIDYSKNPIKDLEELDAALIGSYALMASQYYYGSNIIGYSEVRSRNAYSDGRSNRQGNVSSFALTPSAAYAADTWRQVYKVISEANRILSADIQETVGVKNIKGQAYVLRALAHFDLLRIYGEQYVDDKGLDALGIPYIKAYADIDNKVVRGTVAENRASIYEDLDKGISLLSEENSNSKIKISLATAYGIKSRVGLFFSNWEDNDLTTARDNAELAMIESGAGVIARSAFADAYKADDPQGNSVFELKQSGTDNPGTNSLYYLYASEVDGYGDILVNFDVNELFGDDAPIEEEDDEGNIIVTPANDIRADISMIGIATDGELRNLGKYPAMTSNIKIMRFEELILNYIEADFRINNGSSAEGLTLFNELRENRLTDFVPLTTYDLEDIRLERQKELLFEGFGFEDLMRFHLPIENMYGVFEYGQDVLAFPIPQSEINASSIPQNQAYK